MERELKIKDKYLKKIIDIGFDYDGYEKAEDLKRIIDELVEYARRGLRAEDQTCEYTDGKGKEWNILMEELKYGRKN